MKKTLRALLICVLSSLVTSGAILAEPDPGTRHDWPVWSGPDRNLTSLGNGIFDRDHLGLEKIWSRPLGSAYSGISIVGDRVVTGFSDGESDFLVSLDAASGEEQWRYRISDAYKGHDGSDDGPIATPMIADGVVYGLGAWGHLFALSLADGHEIWAQQVVETLGARKPAWGFTTTPTVVGDVLVVETGGNAGRAISAFDRRTGQLRWSTGDDTVGYQSPLAYEVAGEPRILAVTNRNLVGLEPATGKVLWQHQHAGGGQDGFSQPVPVGDGGVLLTYWPGAALYRLEQDGVEEVWRSKALRGTYATPVPYQGYLYGFSGRFLTCVDAATGETVWKSRPPGGGHLVLVDGHLVILAPSGELVVAEATPEGYREKARVQALDRGYYTRPSFAGGRVYLRNLTDIAAVGVTSRAAARPVTRAVADQELEGDFGKFVHRVMAADDKQRLIADFMASHEEFPILEDGYAHFVYRGEVEDLALTGNLLRDGQQRPMHRIPGTDFHYLSVAVPPKAQFTYRFAVYDSQVRDPLNPRTDGPRGRGSSLLTTAGWQAPADLAEPRGERGRITSLRWQSALLGNQRVVQVYLPPGYGETEERYPLLVVNQGNQALAVGHIDRSLDNLIGKTVAPVIVALVPGSSCTEYGGSKTGRYAEAVATELVPYLDSTFRTVADRKARGVTGTIGAGFASIYAAFKYPEVFTKASAQSFYEGEQHADLLAMLDDGFQRDLDLLFHWSTFGYQNPRKGVDTQRQGQNLVAKLRDMGYQPTVIESNDGFGWGMWRAQTGRILEEMFPLE